MNPIIVWFVIGVYILTGALTILSIGKPRDPITPGLALGSVLVSVFMVWLLLSLMPR